jgi:hypothetical protein
MVNSLRREIIMQIKVLKPGGPFPPAAANAGVGAFERSDRFPPRRPGVVGRRGKAGRSWRAEARWKAIAPERCPGEPRVERERNGYFGFLLVLTSRAGGRLFLRPSLSGALPA